MGWRLFPNDAQKKPMFLELRSAEWFIVSSVAIAVFSEIFLYAVVVPVLPFSLSSRAGVLEEDVQKWTAILLAVYAAFLLVFSPISGWVADRTTTRRGPLLLSLLTFAGATVLLMLGTNVGILIAGRALQGASAAAVWSIGLALLVDTVGVDRIGEAMGWVSLAMSLGVFCGPLLGGVVYEKAGYYAVFYMCFGVIALDIILRVLIVEKRIAQQWLGDDHTGKWRRDIETGTKQSNDRSSESGNTIPTEKEQTSLPVPDVTTTNQDLSSSARTAAPASNRSSSQSIPSPPVSPTTPNTLNAVSDSYSRTTITPTPPQPQNKHRRPAVLTLLSSPRLLIALLGTLVVSTINTSFDTIIPLRVATLFSWTSTGAGLIFLAIIIPSLINPLVGRLVDRVGSRLIIVLGFLLLCPALVCLRFVTYNSLSQKVLLCALLAIAGAALSALLVPVLAEITCCVESIQNEETGRFGPRGAFAQGYGLMNASYAVGTLVGPIWSGFAVENVGWGTATWTLGLFAGVAAVPMFLFLGGWIGKRGWREEILRPEKAITRKSGEENGTEKGVEKPRDEESQG